MNNYALSLAFIGVLLSSVSLVQARDIVFYNQTDKDVKVRPTYDSARSMHDLLYCSTVPFIVPKKSWKEFHAGSCSQDPKAIFLTVPGNPQLSGYVHDLPLSNYGSPYITINEENNAIAGYSGVT